MQEFRRKFTGSGFTEVKGLDPVRYSKLKILGSVIKILKTRIEPVSTSKCRESDKCYRTSSPWVAFSANALTDNHFHSYCVKIQVVSEREQYIGVFLGKIMDIISGLPDELLVKILSFLPTRKVVSTSILSKRWESLWMWVPKLQLVINHHESDLPLRDFITKNLSLLKRPVLESFHLQCYASTFQPEDINQWIGTTVSRCVRELTIKYLSILEHPEVLLPSSLYRCKSLVILRLDGKKIIVDVPGSVELPCLKTLELGRVTYSKEDSLKLLLSYCTVLENLSIDQYGNEDDVKTIVINVPSLLRLSLELEGGCDRYVIVTPCLKYFKVDEFYSDFSYSNARMPQVEEADLSLYEHVERHFKPITSVKRFSLSVLEIYKNEFLHRNGIVFNRLEHLKLHIKCYNWSKLLVWLLEGSPKLRVLKILNEIDLALEEEYWYNIQSCVPTCLLESLETLEFRGYRGTQEERDVVCFILQNAPHLKSSSISHIYNSE